MEITDLTGTTWKIKKPSEFVLVNLSTTSNIDLTISCTISYSSYSVTITNGTLRLRSYEPSAGYVTNNFYVNNVAYPQYRIKNASSGEQLNTFYMTSLQDFIDLGDISSTLTILGGTDVTNSDLIAWLNANAIQLTAVFDLDTLGLSAGTYTITAKAEGSGFQDSSASNPIQFTVQQSGFEVVLSGDMGAHERVYVQINDDPTWYYARLSDGMGFQTSDTNIPNVYEVYEGYSIGIPNVSKIKIGTQGNPGSLDGPRYYGDSDYSSGDFVNLTFTSTGGSAPAYATGVITMTQDSSIYFMGDD